MPTDREWKISTILVFVGGFISLLAVAYYIQQLAFKLGEYYGVLNVVNLYNITSTKGQLTILSQSNAISIALHDSYLMLPFAIIIFSIGILWFFSKSTTKLTSVVLGISAIIYMMVAVMLETNITFADPLTELLPYIGAIPVLASSALIFINFEKRTITKATRRLSQIAIHPETPYTNMQVLSNKLMGNLKGELKILDLHFDTAALGNLIRLISGHKDKYTKVEVLTKRDRLGGEFERAYRDFKEELRNNNVDVEVRVLDDERAAKQHERLMMDHENAYKIPPLNIIQKKNEHIVGINHKDASRLFAELWQGSVKFENLNK